MEYYGRLYLSSIGYVEGFPSIFESAGSRWRYFWIGVTLGSFCMGLYSCYAPWLRYYNEDVFTTVDIEAHDIMRLPFMVVCPFKRFSKKWTKVLLPPPVYEDVEDLLNAIITVSGNFRHLNLPKRFMAMLATLNTAANKTTELLSRHNMTLEGLVANLSWTCEDMVKSCNNEHGVVKHGKDCCSPEKSIMSLYGYCPVLKEFFQEENTIMAGSTFELITVKKVNRIEYGTPAFNGIVLALANNDMKMASEFVYVPGKYHAEIIIEEVHKRLLKTKRKTCNENGKTKGLCLLQCTMELPMIETNRSECQTCNPLILMNFTSKERSGFPICSPVNTVNCLLLPLYANTLSPDRKIGGNTYTERCGKLCQDACNTNFYELKISYSRYAKSSQEENADTLPVSFRIAHRQLQIKLISERHQLDWITVVAEVGGILGLWVGTSLFGILQFILLQVFFTHPKALKLMYSQKTTFIQTAHETNY